MLRQTNNVSGTITGITPTGSVAGVVLYDEGFIVLTGSWNLSNHLEDYGAVVSRPRWLDFAYTGSTANPSSSFQLAFSGTTYTPTLTMMTHMPKAELNHSNNPTFLSHGQTEEINKVVTGSSVYAQNNKVKLTNIVKTNFKDPPGKFQKNNLY